MRRRTVKSALETQAEALRALRDEVHRQNEYAESVVATQNQTAMRTLADVLSKNLGGGDPPVGRA